MKTNVLIAKKKRDAFLVLATNFQQVIFISFFFPGDALSLAAGIFSRDGPFPQFS